jgi:anthranilate phosphoribosyltransferase
MVAANLTSDLKAGARLAEEAIDCGKAREKLDKLVELSQNLE